MVRRKRINNNIEKDLLIGMITSSPFLRDTKDFIKPNLFEIPYARHISQWCLDYYDEYENAPNEHIQDVYNKFDETTLNEELSDNIAEFLATLSRHYDKSDTFNSVFYVNKARDYTRKQALKQQIEETKQLLDKGHIDEAENTFENYSAVIQDCDTAIEPLGNADAFYKAFQEDAKPMLHFPGALGNLVNKLFKRGSFIGLLGASKKGKTWWLSEIIKRGLKARYNVAFFQAGDMTESQWIRRFGVMLAGYSDDTEFCGDVQVPLMDCELHQNGTCELVDCESVLQEDGSLQEELDWYEPCSECKKCKDCIGTSFFKTEHIKEPLDWRTALKKSRRFMQLLRGARFKLDTYSNSTLTFKTIRQKLKQWDEQDGFVPDIICVDYADIMGEEDPRKDERGNENLRWKQARKLSQDYNNLVIMPTQADAQGYTKKTLDSSNFNSDRRKNDHITGMIGLNQTDDEKKKKIMRLNVLQAREIPFIASVTVSVLQCLEKGQVVCGSYYTKESKQVNEKESENKHTY